MLKYHEMLHDVKYFITYLGRKILLLVRLIKGSMITQVLHLKNMTISQ